MGMSRGVRVSKPGYYTIMHEFKSKWETVLKQN